MIDAGGGGHALDVDPLLLPAVDEAELWAYLLAPPAPLDSSLSTPKPLVIDHHSLPSPSLSAGSSASGAPMEDASSPPGPSASDEDVDMDLEILPSRSSSDTPSAPPSQPMSRLEMLWAQEDASAAKKSVGAAKGSGPPSALLWTDPAPALQQVEAPNADTMELRRLKNREFMRRARGRQRDDYQRMKATVARLEKRYAELSCAAPALEDALVVPPGKNRRSEQHQRRFVEVLALAKRLRAENLFLKASLQDQASWKQHLHRILDSTKDAMSGGGIVDAFRPSLGSPLSSPVSSPSSRRAVAVAMPARPMVLHLDVLDRLEANSLFHFSSLDEAAIARVVVDNAHETQAIRASLMATIQAKDPCARRSEVLGWDVVQRVRGTFMEYVQTKTFRQLDVEDAGHKMWMNDMQTDSFRQVLAELRRVEVLQRVGPNAYILGRDIKPFDGDTVFRSVFMRFRTQVRREIPNGSAPPLQATGFIIGSHSLNRDWSHPSPPPPFLPYRPGDGGERPPGLHDGEALEWADFVYLTEFLTVEDPATGDTYHQIQWIGRSDFKSHAEAQRNAPDSLSVCLRTEMLFFSPAIRLPAIGDAEAR